MTAHTLACVFLECLDGIDVILAVAYTIKQTIIT